MIARVTGFVVRHAHVNWALADQAMVSGVNFLTGIMLARYLGLEEFGRFTLAWMAVLFVNSVQHAAINSPMMSIGPKQERQDEPAYYGAVALQQAAFGLTVFALVWGGTAAVAATFPDWNISGIALPLACAALAFQIQDFLRRYFFTRGRAHMAFFTDALRYGGQLVVLFWLFQTTKMDSAAALWVIAALAALGALAAVPAVGAMAWKRDAIRAITTRHWHFSKWLVGSALMQWTSGQLFFIAAGAMLGATAVGAMRATQNLMGVVHIIFMGLENIVPVRAAHHFHHGGSPILKAYLLRVTVYGELATGVVAAIMFAAPEVWLGFVFGQEYLEYGYVLRWWAAIYLVIFAIMPLGAGLRATDRTRTTFLGYLATTIVSIIVIYPLVVFLGVTGIMVGLFSTYLVLVLFLWRGVVIAMRIDRA